MKTWQSLRGTTSAYNQSASWMRHHQQRCWTVTTDNSFDPACINDFGDLVEIPWSVVSSLDADIQEAQSKICGVFYA